MKIMHSDISFSASHSFGKEDVIRESLSFWKDVPADGKLQFVNTDTLTLSAESIMRQFQRYSSPQSLSRCIDPIDELDSDLLTTRLTLEALTGKKINITSFQPTQHSSLPGDETVENTGQIEKPFGWGFEYDYFESHSEEEALDFSVTGYVTTDENKKIDIAYHLAMSRQFYQEISVHFQAGDGKKKLVDPLVINLDNLGIQFGSLTLDFDLDGDGRLEEISFVSEGSGFIALDVNNDGVINDGSELFGPQTGNGFTELAKFDSDGNGWLDEGDPIFDSLKIWMADYSGNLILTTLAEKNIGAIFLGVEDTDFTYVDEQNNPLAKLRKSSIALSENGSVSFVGELDLVV